MPLNPVKTDTPTATGMGVIGIEKGGAFIFNHLSAPGETDNVAAIKEAPSLDSCGGHAAPGCVYHFHSFTSHDECAFDAKWDSCEWIATLLDGHKLYSHCLAPGQSHYLRSCWRLKHGITDSGSTSSYEHIEGDNCELDMANGYDFTGKGIVDPDGNEITGYAYVASEDYPWVMPYLYGEIGSTCDTFQKG